MKSESPSNGRLGKALLFLALVLVANSAYVAAFGDPNLFYVSNALLHPVLGVLAAVLFILYIARHRELFAGLLSKSAIALLALAAGFGGYIGVVGMIRPHSLALYAHVSAAIVGLALLLFHLRRQIRNSKFETRNSPNFEFRVSSFGTRAVRWLIGVAAASAIFYVTAVVWQRVRPNPQYFVKNPPTAPLTMDDEGAGKDGLFFPSSARTTDGKPITSAFFMDSKSCQQCHPDIYKQWESSMHHFASFNNQWYRKSIEYMQDTIGIKSSMWCSGCHDHALALADLMQTHPIREVEFTPQAQNGLGCMSCHAIVHVQDTMGNGGFVMGYPPLDKLATSKNPLLKALHSYAIYLDPKPHRNAFLKPFHKDPSMTPEFCSACHKVHLDVPVNNYRWIRGFDDYDNWQASGVSGQGARSFYYPPKPQQCADCHMPLEKSNDLGNINGYVHSHRFAAANTAVPTSHGDTEQVQEVEKFLKGALSVDIFALAEEPKGEAEEISTAEGPQLSSTFAVGEESSQGLSASVVSSTPPAKIIAPLGRAGALLRRGETARVEVVVRTLRVGHFFPGGTVDAFDCWVELEARDNEGHVIFWSGQAADDGKGPVDPSAHFYRSLQLDAHGNPINKRNAWATRAVMYTRLIPPGAADTVHYRIKIPADASDPITFTAKLNYRKFAWWNTQWAFAGVHDPNDPAEKTTKNYDDRKWLFTGDLSNVSAKEKKIPNVPTVVIAQDQVTLPVEGGASKPFEEKIVLNPQDRSRWNDYGIGLLLQGDLKGAERAFQRVTEIDPKYADGWVNVARARVQQGNTAAAKPLLEKALALNPNLASAHYFMGLALKTDGKYPEAFEEFAKASALYPRDRVVRNQMGRMLFLQRKFADAVAEYQKTLAIDPEDLEAHYNLMLCYRGLNDDAKATPEQRLYLRFKANEAAMAITGPYKLDRPFDNNEAQPIHEHDSGPLGPQASKEIYSAVAGENLHPAHAASNYPFKSRGGAASK
ncbi:MAG: tetratricopeptide repeat protein [Deltaproteobacteria bacterium]